MCMLLPISSPFPTLSVENCCPRRARGDHTAVRGVQRKIHMHRDRQEELASHIDHLVMQLPADTYTTTKDAGALRAERRTLDAKESALQKHWQTSRAHRPRSRRLRVSHAGEMHLSTRFSLQLEVDCLKRDLEPIEVEGRAGAQAGLDVSERLDCVQARASRPRGHIADLEAWLSKNPLPLLLTIYQYMDKILGMDKTPKKAGQAETKPFTSGKSPIAICPKLEAMFNNQPKMSTFCSIFRKMAKC
ncbi:hypothetical protein FB451DRAFT_1184793 [Mycena latifolia]|nr:hypothetical protein FB451DRAFT_1184793 [Mycena latifolia]